MTRFASVAVAISIVMATLFASPSAAATGSDASLSQLYCAYFDWAPDPAGLGYWRSIASNGVALEAISDNFAISDEYRILYGNTTNEEFVTRLYLNVMKRSFDPEGAAYWQSLLDNGSIVRGELMVFFSDSDEYRTTVFPAQADCQLPIGPTDDLTSWQLLNLLVIEPETNHRYVRSDYDQDGAASRRATIERDSRNGTIYSPYDGLTLPCTVTYCPADVGANSVQKDHVVALNEAHDSGAWAWDDARKVAFSNDLTNLRMVSGTSNSTKGASDPADWLPTISDQAVCDYLATYLRVKATYALTVDTAEHAAIETALTTSNCS